MRLSTPGLSARQAVVLLDREQGGAVNLKNKGITFNSVFQVSAFGPQWPGFLPLLGLALIEKDCKFKF